MSESDDTDEERSKGFVTATLMLTADGFVVTGHGEVPCEAEHPQAPYVVDDYRRAYEVLKDDHHELKEQFATLREERDRYREALKTIRGWREIDVSSDERHLPGQLSAVVERIEQICDAALTKGEKDD